MEQLFGYQQHQSVLLYLDYIIVFSSLVQQHLQRLKMVFDYKMQAKGKIGKVHIFSTRRVHYLGHVISSQGRATDTIIVEAVAHRPPALIKDKLCSL